MPQMPPQRHNRGTPPVQPEKGRNEQHHEPRIQNRWIRASLMVLVTVAGCIFIAVFAMQSANDLFGLNQSDNLIEIEIPEGATLADISTILGRYDVINHPITFRFYTELRFSDAVLHPGSYVLNSNMGYNEIIAALRAGNQIAQTVRLTFYEGETIWDIAHRLEENGVVNARVFVDYLNTADFPFEFMNAMPDDPHRFHRLEGYLFPDTYDFFIGENVGSVARKFLNNFNNRITEDLRDRMLYLNLTLDELITLASIIQREAGHREDMHVVSSVFHNRLNNPATFPRLQADVTILYVEANIRPFLLQDDQDMYDAYNTYVRTGLPVGPISNPGMDAILAALHPSDTNYFFFVTDIYGNFFYSETLAQHLSYVSVAMADGGAQGVGTIQN